jgi:hypothetical protein
VQIQRQNVDAAEGEVVSKARDLMVVPTLTADSTLTPPSAKTRPEPFLNLLCLLQGVANKLLQF